MRTVQSEPGSVHKSRVTFLLPGAGREPIGGFKIVYEYANRLAARGYRVRVVHASLPTRGLPRRVQFRRGVGYVLRALTAAVGPAPWFALDHRVRSTWVPSLAPRHIPGGDAVVATSWQTAEWAAGYPESKGRKFYLIQHLETWSGEEARVLATWKLPFRKIVIARWLGAIAESLEESYAYIPYGLDFDAFGVDQPPESRRPDSFFMLHHTSGWKGTKDGLAALLTVRERFPDAEIHLFGVSQNPGDLPVGFRYHRTPTQPELRALYNRAAIFVAPSLTEGWGLPATEAMMSGCALAATDTGGHREFAIHGETALVSPPGDPQALAANLLRLAEDQPLRYRIARSGHRYVQALTWDRAVTSFERELAGSD